MASLTNVTIFSMKFISARIANLPLSRLPVIHARSQDKQIQLYVVVPSSLVPPNTGISRSLTRSGTAEFEAAAAAEEAQVSRMTSAEGDDENVAAGSGGPPQGDAQSDGRETEIGVQLALPPPLSPADSVPPAADLRSSSLVSGAADLDGADAAHVAWSPQPEASSSVEYVGVSADQGTDPEPPSPAAAASGRGHVHGRGHGTRGSVSASVTSASRARPRSLNLSDMLLGATAKDAVAIPLTSWPREPLLSVKCIVRWRRTRLYESLAWTTYVLCCAATMAALIEGYNSLWLAAAVFVVVITIQVTEITRMDRQLFFAVVRSAVTLTSCSRLLTTPARPAAEAV
jgi:hypothetical protein